MPAEKRVKVVLDADINRYSQGLNQAATQTRRFGQDVQRVGQQQLGFFDRAAAKTNRSLGALGVGAQVTAAQMKAGVAVGAAVAGAAVLKFGKDSVDAASNLNEATNKTGEVFGSAAAEVLAFGETAADAIGQSKRQAISAAADFGNMFNTIGLAEDRAAEMSTTMVGLASDMASFNDEDPSAMLDRLRSGLAGEAEPLRRFGVLLSAAEVQAFAYANGIAAVGQELTEAQKVQARYGLILEQTTTQQGDFARTSGDLANQERSLDAQIEDLQATIGESLVPAVELLVDALSDGVTWIDQAAAAVRGANEATGGWAGKILTSVGTFGNLRLIVATTADMIERFTESSGEAGLATRDLASAAEVVENSFRGVGDAVEAGAGRVRDWSGVVQLAELGTEELVGRLGEFESAVLDQESAMLSYQQSLQSVVDTLARNGAELDRNTAAGLDNRQALLGLTQQAFSMADAIAEETNSTRGAVSALMDHSEHLAAVMRQAGFTEAQIASYINTIGLTPRQIVTRFDIDVSAALANLRIVGRAISQVAGALGSGLSIAGSIARRVVNPIRIPSGIPTPSVGGGGGGGGGGGSAAPQEEGVTAQRVDELFQELLERRADPAAIEMFAGDAESAVRAAIESSAEFARLQEKIEARRREDIRFEFGEIGNEEYLKILRQRLQGFQAFSDRWVDTRRQIQRVEEDVLREEQRRAEERRRLEEQRQRQAEERQQRQREREDVLFEIGRIGNDRYVRILQQRLSETERFTHEWLRIHNQITEITEQAADRQVDAERQKQDNMFRLGRLSIAQFTRILEARLAAAEAFSDEWMEIRQQLSHVRELGAIERSVAGAQTSVGLPSFDRGGFSDWPEHEGRLVVMHGQELTLSADQLRALRTPMPGASATRSADAGGVVNNLGPVHFHEIVDPRFSQVMGEITNEMRTRGR